MWAFNDWFRAVLINMIDKEVMEAIDVDEQVLEM